MSPLLLAVTLSALPCGLTEEWLGDVCDPGEGADQDLDAGMAPAGLECWERHRAGNGADGVWSTDTTWLDPVTCQFGRIVHGGGGGNPRTRLALPDEPPLAGVTLSPTIQAALLEASLPTLEDPKNPAHALAKLDSQLPRGKAGVTMMPTLRWWPGPVPPPSGSIARRLKSSPGFGKCPCYELFSVEQFKLFREDAVGGQTISIWSTPWRNQKLAIAVTDAGGKRHRWILTGYVRLGGTSPVAHVEGNRWYLVTAHAIAEEYFVLGYDAKTGQAWKVGVPRDTSFGAVSDAGVELDTPKGRILRSWSSFGPAP